MLWNIVKGVVAAVLVTKISERYFKDKNRVTAPAQSNARSEPDLSSTDVPGTPKTAKPRAVRRPATAKPAAKSAIKPKAKPAVKQALNDGKTLNDPLNATESTI